MNRESVPHSEYAVFPGLFQRDLTRFWREESDRERRLRQLGERYHRECDAYDARVCTGRSPRTGEPVPVDPNEYSMSSRHAPQVRRAVLGQGQSQGFTEQEVVEAIRQADCVGVHREP